MINIVRYVVLKLLLPGLSTLFSSHQTILFEIALKNFLSFFLFWICHCLFRSVKKCNNAIRNVSRITRKKVRTLPLNDTSIPRTCMVTCRVKERWRQLLSWNKVVLPARRWHIRATLRAGILCYSVSQQPTAKRLVVWPTWLDPFKSEDYEVRRGSHFIRVSAHKTAGKNGPANIVITESLHHEICNYIELGRPIFNMHLLTGVVPIWIHHLLPLPWPQSWAMQGLKRWRAPVCGI